MIIFAKEGYPFQIFSKLYFLAQIFHPNVDKFGKVSLDILENQWSQNLTIGKIILSIQSLLNDPNPYEFFK